MYSMYCNIATVLLIITVDVVVVLSCPNKCICTGSIFNCTNQRLTVIPNIPSGSYTIDLTRNQFTNIKRFTFFNMPNLNFLYLNGNELENIEEGAFVLLDKLRHLYLHNNRLTTIKKGIFKDLPDLYWLRLQNNKISVIEAYAFTNLPGLGILYLQNNNITAITHRIFDGIPGIWHIDMRGSNVTFVKNNTFEHLKTLGLLYLEIVCNCQNMPFLLWIQSRSIYGITCSDRNNTRLSNLHVCHFKDCDNSPCPPDYCANGGGNRDIVCSCVAEWTGPRCTDPTTELNDIQTESSTSQVTTDTTAYAVIFGSVGGIVGLSVIVVVVTLFMKRTSILKKFKDSPKQKGSALYENEIRLDNPVYQDLTLDRRDNESTYDAIHNFNT